MFGLSMISLIIGSFAIIPITIISHGTASSIVLVLTINIISVLGLLLARVEKNHTQTGIGPILMLVILHSSRTKYLQNYLYIYM